MQIDCRDRLVTVSFTFPRVRAVASDIISWKNARRKEVYGGLGIELAPELLLPNIMSKCLPANSHGKCIVGDSQDVQRL